MTSTVLAVRIALHRASHLDSYMGLVHQLVEGKQQTRTHQDRIPDRRRAACPFLQRSGRFGGGYPHIRIDVPDALTVETDFLGQSVPYHM